MTKWKELVPLAWNKNKAERLLGSLDLSVASAAAWWQAHQSWISSLSFSSVCWMSPDADFKSNPHYISCMQISTTESVLWKSERAFARKGSRKQTLKKLQPDDPLTACQRAIHQRWHKELMIPRHRGDDYKIFRNSGNFTDRCSVSAKKIFSRTEELDGLFNVLEEKKTNKILRLITLQLNFKCENLGSM